MKGIRLGLCALWFSATGAFSLEHLDGIAAIVDGRPILQSDLMTAVYQSQSSGTYSGVSSDSLVHIVLDRMIDEKVVVARAKRDSIEVSDAEVKQRVDQQIRSLAARQHMPMDSLEKAIRAQLGIGLAQYRDQLGQRIRDQLLIGKVRSRHVGMVTPTRKEVEEFYKEYKDSIPSQYNCIRIQHLQIRIQPSKAIVDSVKALAEVLVDSLDKGIAFEILAKRHSQDGSAQQGGDIGFFRRGALEPEYERAAARLDLGMYTDRPVKTRLGWHIIRLLAKRDDETRTAHILLQTIPSAGDTAAVRATVDSIRTSVLAGADFGAAARALSDDKETKLAGGDLGWFERSEVDSAYQQVVARLQPGDISEPLLIDGSWHIFRLADAKAVRELNLAEDYPRIEEFTANTIASRKLEALVVKWRREVHVETHLR